MTNATLKDTYSLLVQHHLSLEACYIPSHLNVTDALSRGDVQAFLAGFPTATIQSDLPLPPSLAHKLLSL